MKKQTTTWRRCLCSIMAIMMLLSLSTVGLAADTDNIEILKNDISEYVESWFNENFSEHYILSGYKDFISDVTINGNTVSAMAFISAYTTLKYNSVEDLPYMQGIKQALNVKSLAEVVPVEFVTSESTAVELDKSVAQGLQAYNASVANTLSLDATGKSSLTARQSCDNLVKVMNITPVQANNLIRIVSGNFIDAAECIGEPTYLTIDLYFSADYNSREFNNVTIEQHHGDYAINTEEEIIPLSAAELKVEAISNVVTYLANPASSQVRAITRGQSVNYDRVAARNYAWEHTAPGYGYNDDNPDGDGFTPTTECEHGEAYVDRRFWNTDDYPNCLDYDHCHNDCACFVSQCMVAGGIEPTDDWYYSSTKWASSSSLVNFITSSEIGGYETTFYDCNAGNIVYWVGHVALCTKNDTITHRYTGHTNDRNNQLFSSADAYYMINAI